TRRTPGRRRTSGRQGEPRRRASAGSARSGVRHDSPWASARRSQLLPERIPREASDADVLADLGDRLRDQVLDRPVLVPEGLLVEADLAVPLVELALDDPLLDLGRLALDRVGRGELGLLRRDGLLGDPLDVDVQGCEARDLDREVADELLELVGAGDEVGLAVDLDQHADPAARVDVAGDDAFARVPARLLGGCREPSLAEQD